MTAQPNHTDQATDPRMLARLIAACDTDAVLPVMLPVRARLVRADRAQRACRARRLGFAVVR